MKKKGIRAAFAAAALVLATVVVPAVTGQSAKSQSMADMMQQCKTHCQQTSATIDKTTKAMDEAKQSNDPARMRAAIDEAEKTLSAMKEHMNMCSSMMSMMQNMQGGKQK